MSHMIKNLAIKKLVLVTMVAVFAVAALTACGKKGRLENDESEYPRHYPSGSRQ